jgi:hypothetical protein
MGAHRRQKEETVKEHTTAASDGEQHPPSTSLDLAELKRVMDSVPMPPWHKWRGQYKLRVSYDVIGIFVLPRAVSLLAWELSHPGWVLLHPSIYSDILRRDNGPLPISDDELAAMIGWHAEMKNAKAPKPQDTDPANWA